MERIDQMEPKYVIVQAGGRGTRMESLTRNKPKALVPVNNLPMLFHLFRKYPEKEYIIIGGYKSDVLEKYLHTFAEVKYTVVDSSGHVGTCAGLQTALSYVPNNECFLLIWCDLVLSDDYRFPNTRNDVIGISKDFSCRWQYADGIFKEERGSEHGVAGFFIFQDKNRLSNTPEDGELVRWMQDRQMVFEEQSLYHTHEYGLYSEWNRLPKTRCRPFNRIEINGSRVYKYPVDKQGRDLAVREANWYRKLIAVGGGNR